MNTTQAITTFVALLERQAALIEELAAHEAALADVVARREWMELEKLVPRMTAISEAIGQTEEERNALYSQISAALGSNVSFARVLALMPEELRTAVSQAYRALKVAVLRLQSRTSSMDAYLRSTISTTRGVLKELYPEHAAAGYSRDGQGNFGGAAAVMVDHHR